VKRVLLSSAITAVLIATCFTWVCLSGSQASGQQTGAPAYQGTSGIALVDINYIFKRHVRLKASLTDLQTDATRVQKEFEGQLQQLQEESRKLAEMKPGTPQYTQLEESLVNRKAMIQGQIALKRKEFEQKEAHLYFNAYKEISEEVAAQCQSRGITLVLNFNGDPIKDDSPQDVARSISSKVVFYTRPLDITPIVEQRFIRPLAPASAGPMSFNPGGPQR
jgi:Skp family chaperone for outer membrane proteins